MERLTERDGKNIIVKEDYGENALRTIYECYGKEVEPHYANCAEGYCAMEKLSQYEDLVENITNYSPKDFISHILTTICDYAKTNGFEATKIIKDIGENLVELSGIIDFDDLEGNL